MDDTKKNNSFRLIALEPYADVKINVEQLIESVSVTKAIKINFALHFLRSVLVKDIYSLSV